MKPFLFLLMFLPFMAKAQLNEHFDDHDFTHNPVWWGSKDKFMINQNRQLQLNDTEAGQAYLATSVKCDTNMEWQFWVRAAFSPSSNNYIRIYLLSDEPDLTKALHGYFLQLGEAGGKDAPEIFRQDGTLVVPVCRGKEGIIASSFQIRFRIIRTKKGNWQLFVDPEGNSNFRLEASGVDSSCVVGSVFGLFCQYTSSNAQKIYMDDIYAGPEIKDNTPPRLLKIKALSDTTLQLQFDESLNDTIAKNPVHYRVQASGMHPDKVELSVRSSMLLLLFTKHFQNKTYDTLVVQGLRDLAGNQINKQKYPFLYYDPQPFDVLFNEIMADPTPSVGLPEKEYIELYNPGSIKINLKGWQLKTGSHVQVFDTAYIASHGYLILAKADAKDDFSAFGPFYGFGSLSLPNSGQVLELLSPSGKLISRLNYSKDWYKNPEKSSGGWSLEQLNPANICSGEENWAASVNPLGGTPGAINSVDNQTVLYPRVQYFQVSSNSMINLRFNQQMDCVDVVKPSSYEIIQGSVLPESVFLDDKWPSSVQLNFSVPFDSGLLYQIKISAALKNCKGVRLRADTSIFFGLPEKAEMNDIIVNEVLFNPLAGGVDYVELYNRSEKIIDLSTLQLGTVKFHPPAANDTLYYAVSRPQRLFLPRNYLLLTSSPDIVEEQYFTNNPTAFLKMPSFPDYPDKEGCVIIRQNGMTIDCFHYFEEMQYPLLNFMDGVALERIRFAGKTNDRNNWHSAAENVGFGTPGFQNSQFVSDSIVLGEIQINPGIFSPDNDGYQDVLPIRYHFSDAGNTITINIFNSAGQLVRHLENNIYVGTSGLFLWDGLTDNNRKAPLGIYIVYIRVFTMNGKTRQFKKTAVLAGKLTR